MTNSSSSSYRTTPINTREAEYREQIQSKPLVQFEGRLSGISGELLYAQGFPAPIGSRCLLTASNGHVIPCEVIAIHGDQTMLMPLGRLSEVSVGAKLIATGKKPEVTVSPDMLGRVFDGLGRGLDNQGPVSIAARLPLQQSVVNPLLREVSDQPFDCGLRSVNALTTIARGQRMGLVATEGVGKLQMLSMLSELSEADIVVIGLIGSSGTTITELVEQRLHNALSKAVVVAVPAEDNALLKVHGALRACTIAEYFRSQGQNVLLLMDSLSRFAQASREIAWLTQAGQGTVQSVEPMVQHQVNQLLGRCGQQRNETGSITGIYCLDPQTSGMSNASSLTSQIQLEGQLVLEEGFAYSGQFPAFDLERSQSLLMPKCVSSKQLALASRFIRLYQHANQRARVMALDGEFDDQQLDLFKPFLEQDYHQRVNFVHSTNDLKKFFKNADALSNENMS